MTNYTKLTNYAPKDALPPNDVGKVIKGTELGAEFDAISTAIASKQDSSGVATLIQALHPVGSIYMNATNNTNPSTLLGFGTWTAFGAGRVPVGFSSGNTSFDAAEKTGGSEDAIVVAHTHSEVSPNTVFGGVLAGGSDYVVTGAASTTSSTGSSGTKANLQPYITVYMWKRTA